MSKKLEFGLLILWFLVFMYKYPVWENLAFYISDITNHVVEIYDISFFCAVFLFPFLLSLLFLYFFRKYKNNYGDIAQWSMKIIIFIAIWSSFDGVFWVCYNFRIFFESYYLLSFLTFFYPIEAYLSLSLVLLFICLFFFAFGKKNSKLTIETIFWILLFFSPIILGSIYLSTQRYRIPEDIKCEKVYQEEIPKKELGVQNDFKLNGGYGYYSFYVNFKPKEKGYLYIKAFKVTTNDLLSDEYLNDWSKSMIDDVTAKIYSGSFTINKGAGDRYCARIELWFKPNSGKEYMVNQKNYIVEGKD